MMKTTNTGTWETNEIVYVAALKCHDQDEKEMVYDESANSVFWLYEKTDKLMDLVKGISVGEVLVEPRQFNAFFTGTKDAMFDFMRAENVRPARRGN